MAKLADVPDPEESKGWDEGEEEGDHGEERG
mgnify:CR=1 FL=1